MRQWVDCHFWEQEQEEPSEEMLESALNSLYQTFLAESQVIEEEKLSEKQSKPHLAEYQMTLMQGLASLIALKEQYGEAATWDRYPDLMAQCSFDDKERIMNYDQNTEINLREIHDELLPSFLDLFELSPPMWTAIAGQISNYVKMLSEKAPDSVLLAEMGHQWKGLTEKLERQLKERPVLD